MSDLLLAAKQRWWRLHAQLAGLRFRVLLRLLALRNAMSARSVIGTVPVAVSLTTHGTRIESVHLTIESIARSPDRPCRLILWLDSREAFAHRPRSIRRLQARGLEVRVCDNFGPHTKYFPYVQAFPEDPVPLVTADDDLIYPGGWLAGLFAAHCREPALLHCYRARTVVLDARGIRPYAEWPLCRGRQAVPTNFLTGVSGVIYPPRFLAQLRALGSAFSDCCPKADDIWLNAVALRHGFQVRQLQDEASDFPEIPGSQGQALWPSNQFGGANDRQLARTYGPRDLALLRGSDA
jgi:hypothetical protein